MVRVGDHLNGSDDRHWTEDPLPLFGWSKSAVRLRTLLDVAQGKYVTVPAEDLRLVLDKAWQAPGMSEDEIRAFRARLAGMAKGER